jgi:hypothetical protein
MPEARDLVLIEALARVVKNLLRHKLRERVRELTTPLQLPYHYLVAHFLNDIFGNIETNAATQMYWRVLIPDKLMTDFCFKPPASAETLYRKVKQIVFFPRTRSRASSTPIDVEPKHTQDPLLRTSSELGAMAAAAAAAAASKWKPEGTTGFYLILQRLITMMGLVFNPKTLDDLASNPQLFGGSYPVFDSSDLLNLGERVKHLNIVSYAKGYVSIYKGHKASFSRDYISSIRYYESALVAYQAGKCRRPASG